MSILLLKNTRYLNYMCF